jgi:EF hand
MTKSNSRACRVLAAATLSMAYSLSAWADDDVASFATASYATGLRTKEMKNLMDIDGDGMVSRAEWDTYQEKVFTRLDTHNRDRLNVSIFAGRTAVRLGSDFATGGYAQGLSSAELAKKIDANGDGWISREEWMMYQGKVFDLMNTSVTHKGQLGDQELFATGGSNWR